MVSPATWRGIERFLGLCYPAVLPDYIRLDCSLRKSDLKELEAQAGFHFHEALKGNRPFINEAEYLRFPAPRTVWQLRAFLYCELRLLELYIGDGKVAAGDSSITKRHDEFICLNATLEELRFSSEVLELDLPVSIPQSYSPTCY